MNLKIKMSYKNKISVLDWAVFISLGIFCLMFFSQSDLFITAQHSTAYLEGNIFNFYSKCHSMNGNYGANYLPSTFIAFALWNIPLKLFSVLPKSWGFWNTIFRFWNKLLPVLVFFISLYVLYRICIDCFGFNVTKAKITVYLYATCPFAFFSQFIFCQYDVFTVVFVLLGLYHYFQPNYIKKNHIHFVLYFAIAATFKYYALLIFGVLLLLKEKNIKKIIFNAICVLIPVILSVALYLITDPDAFKKAVINFKVLGYSFNSGLNVGFAVLNFMPLISCIIFALAYFTIPNDHSNLVQYSIYYCCGICFALYGFMTWHPQWLMFGCPFWILAMVINKKYNVFLVLQTITGVLFNIFLVNVWVNNADQNMFKFGILGKQLIHKEITQYTMANIYRYGNINTIFSLMVAGFAIIFIFSNPKYTSIKQDVTRFAPIAKLCFVIYAASFILPAFLCLPKMYSSDEVLWQRKTFKKHETIEFFTKNDTVTQLATIDGQSISKVKVRVATFNQELTDTKLTLTIKNSKEEILGQRVIKGENIKDYQYCVFEFDDIKVDSMEQYKFVLSTNAVKNKIISPVIGQEDPNYFDSIYVVQKQYAKDKLIISNYNAEGKKLDMEICGKE